MTFSRKSVVDMLRGLGYQQEADEALRVLPEEFDYEQLRKFGDDHGIDQGALMDRMGGSP
jgi:hypothetical protein